LSGTNKSTFTVSLPFRTARLSGGDWAAHRRRCRVKRAFLTMALIFWSVFAGAFVLPAHAEGVGNDLSQCQGDAFKIDLLGTLDALPDETADAQLDQIRDWVWTTFLARIAGQSKQPELLASVAQQPLFRDDSLSHLLEQPVGRTRSAVGKDGTVYVLVQRTTTEQTVDDVLEAVDQEAFYLGQAPRAVKVYGFDLQMETMEADVCKLGVVNQAWLLAPEQGFRRARVTTASDLTTFLEGGIDLLGATCHTDKKGKPYLEVSGRHRTRDGGGPISVAHVAAVSRKTDGAEGLGFSLDPVTDIAKVRGSLSQILEALPSASRLAALFENWGAEPEILQAVAGEFATGEPLQTAREYLQKLLAEIDRLDSTEAQKKLIEAKQSSSDVVSMALVDLVLHRSSHQSARYDGPLQGTEAAMTMFYTDLLAKLWKFDWQGAAPNGVLPGFVSETEYKMSSAHCDDGDDLPYTRTWFGSRKEGFIRERSGLRLAPNATRIYARGSSHGADFSEEEEPAPYSLRFNRWWDRHYTDVANWEPQYELLNQLVKWTLVRRMADVSDRSGCLDFLEDIDLGPKQKFNSWLTAHANLRWHGPAPLIGEEPTESLPLLESQPFELCGKTGVLEGGVSLPPERAIADRPISPSPKEYSNAYAQRIAPEILPKQPKPGEYVFDLIPRAEGNVRNLKIKVKAGAVEISSTLESDIRLRGDNSAREQYDPITRGLQYILEENGDRLDARESLDSLGVDHLFVTGMHGPAGGVNIELGPRRLSLQLAQEISLRMQSGFGDLKSIAKDVVGDRELLTLDHDMVAVGLTQDDGGQKVYAVLASGDGIRGPPPPPSSIYMVAGSPERGGWGKETILNLLRGNHGSVSILLIPEKDAKPYLRRLKAKPANDVEPAVQAMDTALANGDLISALAQVRAGNVPERVLGAFALSQVRRGDLENLTGAVDLLLEREATSEIRELQSAIAYKLAELKRSQDGLQQAKALAGIQGRIALGSIPLSPREAARELRRQDDGRTLMAYAPKDYSEKRLPPASHRPGRLLPLNERFVTEVIDRAYRLDMAPSEVGDSRLQTFAGGGGGGPQGPGSGGPPDPERLELAANQAAHLIWPLLKVVPCRDDSEPDEEWASEDDSKPSCYRSIGEDLNDPQLALQIRHTAIEILRCDRDEDGEISDELESDCIDKVLESREEKSEAVSVL
jgi:hypothetical protein